MNDPETDRLGPSKEKLNLFLEKEFPQTKCRVVEVGNQTATIAHEIGEAELRPGGTVSGPVLMEVADVAIYVALLREIGIVPLAVTAGLTINFLSKPPATQQIMLCVRCSKLAGPLLPERSDSTPKATKNLLLMRLVPTRFHQSSVPRG